MPYAIIVASDSNRVIGVNNTIPWKSKADMRRFKQVTMGTSVIMGRTTWDSIGRALPGRKIYVVTHRPFEAPEGVFCCASLEAAMEATKAEERVWIAGGESIYLQAMPFVSLVDHTFIPDTVALPLDAAVPIARFPDLPHDFILQVETTNPEDPTLVIKTYYRKPSLTAMQAVTP